MSHFECHLNRHFWLYKLYKLFKLVCICFLLLFFSIFSSIYWRPRWRWRLEWKMLLYVAQLIRLPPTALMIGPLDGNLWVGQGRLSPSCCLAIYRHSSATICGRDRRHRFPLWEQERQVEDRPGGRFEHSAAFGDDDRGGGGRQANKTRSHNAPWLRNLVPAHCSVWTFITLLCVQQFTTLLCVQ